METNNRRDFLKKAALAGASALVAPSLFAADGEGRGELSPKIKAGDLESKLIVPKNNGLKITGTFLDEISHDIPHQNWGEKEWDLDFQHMKRIGIDTVIMIRSGYRKFMTYPSPYLLKKGCYMPSVDLVDMYLRLAEKYNMKFYFGLYDSGRYWDTGDLSWEIEDNKYVIDEVWKMYGEKYKSFGGWYISGEISRATKGAIDAFRAMGKQCKDISNGLPTFISPWIDGKKAIMGTGKLTREDAVSVQQHEKEWNEIFDGIHEVVDACAFQDGHIDYDELDAFFTVNKKLADKYGMQCWTNAESFDRDMPIRFLPIKFDKLRMKLEAAKRAGYDKAITFEFSHFMSPQSAYLQAGHLYDRYREYFEMSDMKSTINFGYLIFLSVVAALGGFLFGYDTAVISGTIAQVTQLFQLDTLQQGWYVGCALIGSIVGVLFAGILSDKLGRKMTMIISATLFSTSALGCAISADFTQLVVYRIIGGVGIGVVSIVSPLYISEVAVAQYRGRLVSLYQLAVTVGFLGAYLINYQLLAYAESGNQLSMDWLNKIFVTEVWRGMLGMETLPAVLFFIIIFFIPESPRWLIVRGKEEKAVNILERIYNSVSEAASQLKETKSVLTSETKSEWAMLMKPGIFKAVIIGVCIAILGQFMGVNAVLYYGPSIFENAGLSGGDSLFYQVLVGLVNTLTTVLALVIIDRVGRKQLVYYGVSGMVVSLLLIGIYFLFGDSWGVSSLFLLVFFLFYVFCCAVSICAVVFVLLSEMYPTKVRGLAMSIAGFALWIGTYLIGQLTPWMLQNLTPAGTFFLFAVMCVPYMLIVWKLVPETTGKSLEEIERYWTRSEQ